MDTKNSKLVTGAVLAVVIAGVVIVIGPILLKGSIILTAVAFHYARRLFHGGKREYILTETYEDGTTKETRVWM